MKHANDMAFTTAVFMWFTACVFARSTLFCDPCNGLKMYLVCYGLLVFVLVALVLVKNTRGYILRNLSWHLYRTLFLSGAMQAAYGISQWMIGGAWRLRLTGYGISGSFDNPSGFASVLAILFPVGVVCYNRSSGIERLWVGSLAAVYITALALSFSRSGILAAVTGSIIALSIERGLLSWLKAHNVARAVFAATLVCMGMILVVCKMPSVYGRLYVWKITVEMIRRQPFLGYGTDGFTANYMTAQSQYFVANPDSGYISLADNIMHPFNEFLAIAVQYGIVGFLVFVTFCFVSVRLALSLSGWRKAVIVSSLSSFLTLSMFTYPLYYSPVWVLLAVLTLSLYGCYLPTRIPVKYKLTVCMPSIAGMCLLYGSCASQLEWRRISNKSLCGCTEEMIPRYETLHKTTMLSRNGRFLYNYAAELNYVKRYDESLEILRECRRHIFDYDVALLYADNMYSTCRYDSAIAYAKLAASMVPCRFVPCHYLLNAYIDNGDSVQASITAHEIMDKPVKVPSAKVEWVRCEAKKYLDGI